MPKELYCGECNGRIAVGEKKWKVGKSLLHDSCFNKEFPWIGKTETITAELLRVGEMFDLENIQRVAIESQRKIELQKKDPNWSSFQPIVKEMAREVLNAQNGLPNNVHKKLTSKLTSIEELYHKTFGKHPKLRELRT